MSPAPNINESKFTMFELDALIVPVKSIGKMSLPIVTFEPETEPTITSAIGVTKFNAAKSAVPINTL